MKPVRYVLPLSDGKGYRKTVSFVDDSAEAVSFMTLKIPIICYSQSDATNLMSRY